MNDNNFERLLYVVLYATLFAGAIYAFFNIIKITKNQEATIIRQLSKKASIVMTSDDVANNNEYVSMTDEEVYANIITVIDQYAEEELESGIITIYISRALTREEMVKIKRRNDTVLASLQNMCHGYSTYRCVYTVNEDLMITAIEYRGL